MLGAPEGATGTAGTVAAAWMSRVPGPGSQSTSAPVSAALRLWSGLSSCGSHPPALSPGVSLLVAPLSPVVPRAQGGHCVSLFPEGVCPGALGRGQAHLTGLVGSRLQTQEGRGHPAPWYRGARGGQAGWTGCGPAPWRRSCHDSPLPPPPHRWTVTRVLWGRPHAAKAFPEGPGEPSDTGVNAGATGRP